MITVEVHASYCRTPNTRNNKSEYNQFRSLLPDVEQLGSDRPDAINSPKIKRRSVFSRDVQLETARKKKPAMAKF